jgi:hypothetical protein
MSWFFHFQDLIRDIWNVLQSSNQLLKDFKMVLLRTLCGLETSDILEVLEQSSDEELYCHMTE